MNIVLGICGGIAVYKACELVRRFKKEGFGVNVIMTRHACEFVTPLTFRNLSGNPVVTDMFEEPMTWDFEHIELARKADIFVVAPATANIIGKIANGIADDLLSTTIMATTAPVLFVPAMNTKMYENKIVQGNMNKLKEYGYHFIEPESGYLACGEIGKGRFPEILPIFEKVVRLVGPNDDGKPLLGKKVLITAGPTREAIDPVRYLTNRSSGKMGYALAKAVLDKGGEVLLISGPVHLSPPAGADVIFVNSASQMHLEVLAHFMDYDIIIMVAAVADYRPEKQLSSKMKKVRESLNIKLVKNPDILKEIGGKKEWRFLVGFCAETDDLISNAKEKIRSKNLDLIVANDVSREDSGFDVDSNIVTLIDKKGEVREISRRSKNDIAREIVGYIIEKISTERHLNE